MKYIISFVILVLPYLSLYAQTEPDTTKILALSDLIDNAVINNTKLEPIEFQKKIEMIKKEQINKQPMPMFEAMIDYIPTNFMEKPEYSAYYSQRLMLPEKLSTGELIGDVNAIKQEISKEQIRIDITRQIKAGYYDLYYYERLLEFNYEYQNIIKNIIKSIESNYISGMTTQSEVIKMNNELQMLEFERIELESEKKISVNNLKVLTNLNLPDGFRTKDLQTILNSTPRLDTIELYDIMLKNNPEFRMIDNMVEGAGIEKNIAKLEKVPDITLKGGYKYMAKEPMSYFNISVAIDLTFMPWNTKRINAMVEEKTVMELQANSIRNSTLQYMKNELQNMIVMINSSKSKLSYLKEVLIPQTEQTFNSALVSYSSGSADFMNLLDTYRKMRESVQMQAKEETELLKQYSELEYILGKKINQ